MAKGNDAADAIRRIVKQNEQLKEYYKTSKGNKTSLPIYYRNAIYTEKEREQHWIQKLDAGERWICGEMVKEENAKELYETLEWYRRINKQLGYGSDEVNWDQKEYENFRRQLMYENTQTIS